LRKYWLSTPTADGGGTNSGSWNYPESHRRLIESLNRFKSEPRGSDLDILLVGDSITWQWNGSTAPSTQYPQACNDPRTTDDNALAWRSVFGAYRTFNVGLGGDKTFGVLWRLDHGAVDGLRPKVIILAIGTNNCAWLNEIQTDVDAAANSAEAIMYTVKNLRKKFPNAAIVVSKILPAQTPSQDHYRWAQRTNTALDAQLRAYALTPEGNQVLLQPDLWSSMTHTDGTLKMDYFKPDSSGLIHLKPAGYQLWANTLSGVVIPQLAQQPAPPSITVQPIGRTVWRGSNVTLSVQATGPGDLAYVWEHAPLRSSSFAPVPNAGNGPSLVVNTSTLDGSRQYRCVVRSAGGAVTSNPAFVHVRNPFFTTQPANQTVPVGTQARFSVSFAGPNPVSYRWEYADANATTFTPFAGSRHTSTWTTEPAGTSGGGDNGRRFRCVITFAPNFGSLTSDPALLTVTRPALPPTGGGAGGAGGGETQPPATLRMVGFGSPSQTVTEGAGNSPHPAIGNYNYPPAANYAELAIESPAWPLSQARRAYVLKPEGERFPVPHNPNTWPVTPIAGSLEAFGISRWLDCHAALVNLKEANKTNADIVLIGDSITQNWGGGFNAYSNDPLTRFNPFIRQWSDRFSGYRTINLGIAGDKTQSILWRLNHGALDGATPKVVVLAIGTNNINSTVYNGTAPAAVAQGIKLCVDAIRSKCPLAQVLVVKPIPMGDVGSRTFNKGKEINDLLDGLRLTNDPKVHVLDFFSDFLTDGILNRSLLDTALLHPSPSGYTLYAERLQPRITDLLMRYDAAADANRISIRVPVHLSSAATSPVTVNFTLSGTATRGADYFIQSESIVIPAGATTAEIHLQLVRDSLDEPVPETLQITLENTVGATLDWNKRSHTVSIQDL
jgi:beta-glucosidase